jgi:glucose/arabinose dehydrogenase
MRRAFLPLMLVVFPMTGWTPAWRSRASAPCDDGNGGLSLQPGYCAVVVAKGLEGVRQVTVGSDGIVYGAMARGDAGVVALRDTNGDGRADERAMFGPAKANDVEVHEGFLYLALVDRVVRWKLVPGQLAPTGEPETIVRGLPSANSHQAKSLAFDGDAMYVNIGAPSNSCQEKDRTTGSPGVDPCRELDTRAGIWLFSASRAGQEQSDGSRYATGIRNATALAVRPGTKVLHGGTHGRDQLSTNWSFSDAYNAENPGEELLVIDKGDDFGWPYCYYSTETKALVLAPEYGGDGTRVDRCAKMKVPVMVFPAHWAPLALAFSGDGAFVAFHGSWNRAPLPQAGYRVVFAPFVDGKPTGAYTTFATGTESDTWLRASGVAVARDGAVYISADRNGMIWKVVRT